MKENSHTLNSLIVREVPYLFKKEDKGRSKESKLKRSTEELERWQIKDYTLLSTQRLD